MKTVFSTLALRNVKRSAKDYIVYFLTMMLVTAIMSAFHSLLFSEDVQKLSQMALLMPVTIGLATFFIVWINAWLISYMVQFMLEKRAREFGVYLLLGMPKRRIVWLYMRENLMLGAGAFAAGAVFGLLLQQILLAVFYGIVQMEYQIRLEWKLENLLLTAGCYSGCYLLALLRCRRKLKKMNIHALMESQRKNEEVKERHEQAKQWLLPLSLLLFAACGLFLFCYHGWGTGTVIGFIIGLVLSIYLFYSGFAAWIICYIRRHGSRIYQGQNLFLLRQFSSKVRSMRFTMGTLTSLFALAMLGCAVALMFHGFQNQVLEQKWPFDVQIYDRRPDAQFEKELAVLQKETDVAQSYRYCIYQNGTQQVNAWLYTHLKEFGREYQKADGTVDWKKAGESFSYYKYDTYMLLSDYNHLRGMVGLDPVKLGSQEYALHIKRRVWMQAGDFSGDLEIQSQDGKGRRKLRGIYTEPFSQDGHNGADYLIIVPDTAAAKMEPYYAELAVQLKQRAPGGLQNKLERILPDGYSMDASGHLYSEEDSMCIGSDSIVSMAYKIVVRDNLVPEVKVLLTSITFPLVYIGLVFVCVALTVLSVQQLSDSAKYKFRYRVLYQIGLGKKDISRVVFWQLAVFYLCPAAFAAGLSGLVAVFAGWKFNFYTGTQTAAAGYFAGTLLFFFVVYAFYFIVAYVGFKRNVEA